MVGAAAAATSRGEVLMSIGEVLAHLRGEFPDTTISKLRFLEAEGLVEPKRTPSGYRKYSWADVTRLRYVLTAQRDHYLPLRVIRDQLAALDEGASAPAAAAGAGAGRIRPGLAVVGAVADTDPEWTAAAVEPAEPRLSRSELLARSGLAETALDTLEQFGLVAPRNGGGYDADALEVAAAAAALAQYGLEPRHLRAYRAAADREIGLFGQLVAPMARQGGPTARARAAEAFQELAELTQRLQAALVRAGLRETLGR
jgi:DNA-binding transcriptional MerR regulator